MRRQIIAIVNPTSGRRAVTPRVRLIGKMLAEVGAKLEIFETTGPGHASHLASQLDPRTEAVLVAGGDGTACEVLNGLGDRRVPVLVLASGTENLLARELAMPTDPKAVARRLLYGEAVGIDVGVVNGQRFVVVAGIGFDAECVVKMMRIRKGHITHWTYFWPIWRTFWDYRFPLLRVRIEEEPVVELRGFALIGNLPRYSVGMRILGRARPDDGLLDVAVFHCETKAALIAHAIRVFRGSHLEHGEVMYRQCRKVEIRSEGFRVPVELDGEYAGVLPIQCEVKPKALLLLCRDGLSA